MPVDSTSELCNLHPHGSNRCHAIVWRDAQASTLYNPMPLSKIKQKCKVHRVEGFAVCGQQQQKRNGSTASPGSLDCTWIKRRPLRAPTASGVRAHPPRPSLAAPHAKEKDSIAKHPARRCRSIMFLLPDRGYGGQRVTQRIDSGRAAKNNAEMTAYLLTSE